MFCCAEALLLTLEAKGATLRYKLHVCWCCAITIARLILVIVTVFLNFLFISAAHWTAQLSLLLVVYFMCSTPVLFSCCLSAILALRALSTENAAHPRTMPCTAFVSFHLANCNCSSFYLSIAPCFKFTRGFPVGNWRFVVICIVHRSNEAYWS